MQKGQLRRLRSVRHDHAPARRGWLQELVRDEHQDLGQALRKGQLRAMFRV